jgi:ferredoxin
VHHRLCDACNQCYQDCPYEAISMIVRPEPDPERSTYVAEVDPSLCVSCGICAGSCAPMGVGPPGRTGRDQLERVRDFIGERVSGAGEVVIVGCDRGAGGIGEGVLDGAPVFAVDCAGSLHTSVVEFLVRSGVGGVLIVACPPRDCWNREGPRWLSERLYHNREAELKPRVDRNRVRVAHAAFGERQAVRDALAQYRLDLTALSEVVPETDIEIDSLCEAPAEEVHR